MNSTVQAASNPEDSWVQEDGLWRDERWTARVIKNEDDEGWAVAMTLAGEQEPALVGPWTMGRDKKNPKPLSAPAFHTLVKTASEVLRRHEQQLHARLHKNLRIDCDRGRVLVKLDIVPDDDNPYATLTAEDASGELIAQLKVDAGFKLTEASAQAWAEKEFTRP
ncbi:hypothetical protein [Roseateles koreensis]|uniref:Uncharacterized protein n=1 Tax=Roseateles koreensis TaxID=2987526 RepID=A0ABT5KLG8_9BURK|nr:hypothetical protein [Roseateles koreensis]MDC8783749.1 hypothetical protein [Roseateles koreensis]